MRNEPLDFWPEEPLFCARCGTTIAADDLFCPRCGQKIERKIASPGWGWYMGLLLLAIALFLCILGIGVLAAYHGLEERYSLHRGAAPTDYQQPLHYADGWHLWPGSDEGPLHHE